MTGTRANPGPAETTPTATQPSKQPKKNSKSKSSAEAPTGTVNSVNAKSRKAKTPKLPKTNSKETNPITQPTAHKKPGPSTKSKKGPKANENVNPAAQENHALPTPTTIVDTHTITSANPSPLATIDNSLEAQLRQRIAELENRETQNTLNAERLERQIQRLKNQKSGDTRPEEVSIVERPKGKFSIRSAMGLGDNEDRAEYKRLVGAIHEVVNLAKLDYTDSWKSQDPTVLGDVFRAAAKREPTLLRFRKHWATSAIVQQYFHNSRAYRKAKTNPDSGVMRRRAKITKVGRREAKARLGNPDEHPASGSDNQGDSEGNPQDGEDGDGDDDTSEGSVRSMSEDGGDEEESEDEGMVPDDDDGAGSDGIDD